MRRSSRSLPLRSLAGLSALLLLPACAQDGVKPDEDAGLTQAESIALAGMLGLESVAFGLRQGPVSLNNASFQLSGETLTISYDVDRACPRGGSVASEGTIAVATEAGPPETTVVDVEATETHNACAFMAGLTELTVTGDPNLTSTVHAATRDHEPWGPQAVSVLGAVRWVADDGRSGRCAVDVQVTVEPGVSSTTRGSACGHTFDVTVNNG